MKPVAGIDLGATTVGAAVGEGPEQIRGRASRETPSESSDAVVDTVLDALEEAAASAGHALDELGAVGIGSMGPLDVERGRVVDPPNLTGVTEIPLVDAVAEATGAPVTLRNDAVAGAIGEAGEEFENLAYVTLSTGIGVGAVVDGTVLSGVGGNAGELGHVPLEPDLPVSCGCGGTGHWEALCSGGNIPALVRTVAETTAVSTTLDLGSLTAPDLFAAVGSDPLADHVVDRLADWNARGVATVVHAYDPAVVRVGGSVALENPTLVVDRMVDRLGDYTVEDSPEVSTATHGHDAVLVGAMTVAVSIRG